MAQILCSHLIYFPLYIGSLLWLSLSPGSLFGFSTGASSSEWLSRVVNYGSEVRGKPTRQGLCGLRNLGNLLFERNYSMPCADQDIRKIYLESTQHSTDDDDDEYVDFAKRIYNLVKTIYSSNGAVTIGADLLRRLWSNEYNSPTKFKSLFGKEKPQFAQYMQEDAHDFLSVLLDVLREDLNRVVYQPS